ncbi:MAG: sulfur carrier protein ThiS [Gammaproteobacteria bacterium]|nr:sulfur carrier protein ThiS [Gammaproteobacteria bacterium]
MQISVNGNELKIAVGFSVEQLIGFLELKGKRIAIELNQDIVPRSQYADVTLKANDRVEIVHAIGGG